MAEVRKTYYENGCELFDNSKRKNMSSIDSFGEYKFYDEDGQLIESCYYVNDIKQ